MVKRKLLDRGEEGEEMPKVRKSLQVCELGPVTVQHCIAPREETKKQDLPFISDSTVVLH